MLEAATLAQEQLLAQEEHDRTAAAGRLPPVLRRSGSAVA